MQKILCVATLKTVNPRPRKTEHESGKQQNSKTILLIYFHNKFLYIGLYFKYIYIYMFFIPRENVSFQNIS